MRGDPEFLAAAVDLLNIDDSDKRAAIVDELGQLARNLEEESDAADRLKFLTDELDNIEKTAGRLATMLRDYDKNLVDIFSITLGAETIYLSRKGGLHSWSADSGEPPPMGTRVIPDPGRLLV